MKRKRIFVFFIVILLLISLYFFLFNFIFTPFKGKNKDILCNPSEYDIYDKEKFIEYYKSFIKIEEYESKYNTEFYYVHGENSFFPFITIIYYYAMEANSYVIFPDNDYDYLKESILNNFRFIETKINSSNEAYLSNIEINGTIFNEIFFKNDDLISEELYLEKFRTDSYWFAFNDEKKELSFSFLSVDTGQSSWLSEKELKKILKNNLYY